MRARGWRVLACGVSACLVLGLLRVLREHWRHPAELPVRKEPRFVPQNRQWSRAHFDQSGHFKILPYVHTAEKWAQLSHVRRVQDEGSVCVALQCSLSRAAQLVEAVRTWGGPVSLALFAPGPEFAAALALLEHLRHCLPSFRNQVSVHVVHPAEWPPSEILVSPLPLRSVRDCASSPAQLLDRLLGFAARLHHDQYPQNVLRNVAREHCQTLWVASMDADMSFPSLPTPLLESTPAKEQPKETEVAHGASARLAAFLTSPEATRCERCVFVLPCYEVEDSVMRLPEDKRELLRLVGRNLSRQYHLHYFRKNQQLSQLNRWERLPPRDDVTVAYQVRGFEFFYEPVYVARRGTPRFEETYLGYGMTRNTQAYELHLAGYSFHVLDGIFLAHRGFPGETSIERRRQTRRNLRLFCARHQHELRARYGRTDPPPGIDCEPFT